MAVVIDALGLLCFLWHWKPAACREQHGFNQVSGNPWKKHHVICEEAETSALLELSTGQWFQTYLVSDEVLEGLRVTITFAWLESNRKSLVLFEKSS